MWGRSADSRLAKINRGAAAGFLLQALGPLLETLGPQTPPPRPCTVVGLPLLAFGFQWLNRGCFTANVLAGSWGYFTKEGKIMVVHLVLSVVANTIFIVSIFFIGSACGVVGSLLLGAAGLLPETGLRSLPAPKETSDLPCLLAGANLSLCST